MVPVFDKPMWKIQRIYEAATFAGMRSEMSVTKEDGSDYIIHVVPPTELFKYLHEVMRVKELGEVELYLDPIPDGGYLFGVAAQPAYHDLWSYKQLPKWAINN